MNLIYVCVFHQQSYIKLLKLLVTSVSVKANIKKETTDILIVTSPTFHTLIQKELEKFDLPLQYYILDVNTLMRASSSKLKIFQYNQIDKYQKILYLDTDVLINSDVNKLFDSEISSDKLYAVEEGNIGHIFWGSMFFDFKKNNREAKAFSAGVLYFMNSPSMKQLFEDTNVHIENYLSEKKPVPTCLEQPFLVYNSFAIDKYDNQFMKRYSENNPDLLSNEKIIYHFPGGPGDYSNKSAKMIKFWEKMQKYPLIFDTRKEMIKYYSNKISNPKILEIGVFKGDFLDYLVKECSATIDAVDLFEGITCSGNEDGNNVVDCDVGKSYLELLDKYKEVPNIKLHSSNSIGFLQSQEDNTYDIIYIDGDHSYDGVKKDLINSASKIKNGGYIMGHDYEMNMNKAKHVYDFSVKQAVDEFCTTYNQSIIAKSMDGIVSFCIQIKKYLL